MEDAEETAWDEIRSRVARMDPFDFQDLVGALLEAMGYHLVWIAPPGPDGGMDLLAQSDPLGARGPRVKGQVKRKPNVKSGEEDLRSFLAVLGDQDVGVFVSLGGGSEPAYKLARAQEKRRITLISLRGVVDLWIDHYDRIPEDRRQLLPLKAIYFLVPRE